MVVDEKEDDMNLASGGDLYDTSTKLKSTVMPSGKWTNRHASH